VSAWVFAPVALFVLGGLALKVWIEAGNHAMQLGQFVLLPADAGRPRFRTDLGLYEVDHARGRLRLVGGNGSRIVPLDSIRQVRVQVTEAMLDRWQEFMLGFDISDLIPAYRDRIVWQVVVLDLEDGTEIPVFAAGQLHRREFLQQWSVDQMESLGRAMRLMPDTTKLSHRVRDDVAALLAPGHAVDAGAQS
jgi:hypothetical protein